MTVRYDDAGRRIELSVRDLLALAPAGGHAGLRLPIARQRRARMGQAVHDAERGEEMAAEVGVATELEVAGWTFRVGGRIDGVGWLAGRRVVEEVKSVALGADGLARTGPEDWPRACWQLAVYRWLLARAEGAREVLARLVLVSVLDGHRHHLVLPPDPGVERRVRAALWRVAAARARWLARLARRRGRVPPLPHPEWRPGQAHLAQRLRDALVAGDRVMVEAPTGTGKTAVVLHAALAHAWDTDRRVVWTTTRNTQQEQVVRTLARIQARAPVDAVVLRSREEMCLQDVVDCRPEACPHANGHHRRVAEARLVERAWEEGGTLDPARIEALARAAGACPYFLARELAAEAEAVVCDVNHALDPGARLPGLLDPPGAALLVVDEAHHLVDRARAWFSAELDQADAWRAVEALREAGPAAAAPLASLAEDIAEAVGDAAATLDGPVRGAEGVVDPPRSHFVDLEERFHEATLAGAAVLGELPRAWAELGWSLQRLVACLEALDEDAACILGPGRGEGLRLRVACLDPAGRVGPTLASLGGLVLVSATLRPAAWHRDLLGLAPDRLAVLQAPSPFPPEHLRVVLATRVSTAWRDRRAHRARTAELVERVVRATPGPAAVFYGSFDHLRELAVAERIPDRSHLVQVPRMGAAERAAMLAELAGRRDERPVLHAVLGGIFGEGVDLPPGTLRTIVVVGPGLPGVDLERELLRELCEARYGDGFWHAWLVPGLRKVVQAAGRGVRAAEDRCVVVLVGRRFGWRKVRALLPERWRPTVEPEPWRAVAAFWEAAGEEPPID